ncbi:uncharacterized protein G2W53_033703 [Senna tora]|uniref:Uncharacterized protein n=1 Tax=Senna tora TaxID=362788 RepID=A0A834T0K5_9FABA|nr:uncharacterized protein G2W53_033703 [Senna tora]
MDVQDGGQKTNIKRFLVRQHRDGVPEQVFSQAIWYDIAVMIVWIIP